MGVPVYDASLTHPWHKTRDWLTVHPLYPIARLYQTVARQQDVTSANSRKTGVPSSQTVIDHLDYTGAHAICNNERDKRPFPPAIEAVVRQDCLIDQGLPTPVTTYEALGVKLYAYIPAVPHLPQQMEIPLGDICRTDLNELNREELHTAFLLARELIRSGQFYRPGIDQVHVEVHFGIVGSQRGHWRIVIGGIPQRTKSYSRVVFALSGKYMELEKRDVAWEALHHIWGGDYQQYLVEGFRTNYDTSEGILLFAPHVQRSVMEGRVAVLNERIKGIDDMPDDLLAAFVEGLYQSIRRFGSIKTPDGKLAVKNLEVLVHSVPLSLRESAATSRTWGSVLVRDRGLWGGGEVSGGRVTALPATTAEILRQNASFPSAALPPSRRTLPSIDVRELGRQPDQIDSVSLDGGKTFTIAIKEGQNSRFSPMEVTPDPLAHKTTVVVPTSWSGDSSMMIHQGPRNRPAGFCVPCHPEELGEPRIQGPIGEVVPGTALLHRVANPFAIGGGDLLTTEELQRLTAEGVNGYRVRPGEHLPGFRHSLGHVVVFPQEHTGIIEEFTEPHIVRMLAECDRAYSTYFSRLGDPRSLNRRVLCMKNLGAEAGGTIFHAHEHMVALSVLASLWTDKKIAVVNSAGRLQIKKGPNPYNLAEKLLPPEGALYGTDLVDVRIFDQVREQDLVLYESPLAIGYVELAPMFPFEACMSILRWGASSRLFLTEEEKAEERKVVNFILERYRRIGVQQLNITDEAAWVGDRTTLWRYTLRFSPRMVDDRIVRVGTPQLDDCFIVPVAPREAAIKLRNTI